MESITRLAPSPTGALHLGNARTFIVNWILARRHGWTILLRIEDLDGPRVRKGADQAAIEDLRWLGLDWDRGPVYQSPRMDCYRQAAGRLLSAGLAYPCACTRSEIATAASAPHAEDGAAVYPGTCFGRYRSIERARLESGREPAIRFHAPPGIVSFEDEFLGPRSFDVATDLGDFVILKGDGTAAYQLAVVVDDAESAVTHIVRGDDLVDSTPRQILLYRALGLAAQIPRHWHLPLVVGADGRRLAKRHGDTRIGTYRAAGVRPQRLLGLIARWCGIPADEMALPELAANLDLQTMPRTRVIFTPEDDRWLRAE